MNTRTLIAAATLALATAGSAFAQEATIFPAADTATSVTRAEVRAEAVRALKQGELTEAAMLNVQTAPRSELSRQAVRADTLRAQRSGAVDMIDAEAFSFHG